MTVLELTNEFRKLSKADRLKFMGYARDINESRGLEGLRIGMKVKFTDSRSGVEIVGTFSRMKRVKAEVKTNQGRFGVDTGRTVIWTVPPAMLTPVEA